jgi:hypothetical protein
MPDINELWCDKSWYIGKKLRDGWSANNGTSIDVILEYAKGSNYQMLGPKDSISYIKKEIITKGNELPRMFLTAGAILHTEWMSMTNKQAIANIVEAIKANHMLGLEQDFATALMKRDAATYSRTAETNTDTGYRLVNLWDIMYDPTSTLHNLTYTDFGSTAAQRAVWQTPRLNGASDVAMQSEDNLMDPKSTGFLVKVIRRMVANMKVWKGKASNSDLAVVGTPYLFSVFQSLMDSLKMYKIDENIAKMGFQAYSVDDVPFVSDGYSALAQSGDTDAALLGLNFKNFKLKFNGEAAFTSSPVTAYPGTKMKVFDISSFGNIICPDRRSHYLVYNVFSPKAYIAV